MVAEAVSVVARKPAPVAVAVTIIVAVPCATPVTKPVAEFTDAILEALDA